MDNTDGCLTQGIKRGCMAEQGGYGVSFATTPRHTFAQDLDDIDPILGLACGHAERDLLRRTGLRSYRRYSNRNSMKAMCVCSIAHGPSTVGTVDPSFPSLLPSPIFSLLFRSLLFPVPPPAKSCMLNRSPISTSNRFSSWSMNYPFPLMNLP